MPTSARDPRASGDRAAQLNDQVAEGHQWAADAAPDSHSDLHHDAAAKYRQAAEKQRSLVKYPDDEAEEHAETR